jgi:hypothetical protein
MILYSAEAQLDLTLLYPLEHPSHDKGPIHSEHGQFGKNI